ncbi:MAG: acyltransferase [Flavisolibacter sp.]|jgi:acetyltransferase-like isoleucine patch superfamily enzyme|nr:acyltransferase [Flavisolibacter sp.]
MPGQQLLYPLIGGEKIPNDWFVGTIPSNIEVGENTVVESSFSFQYFFSSLPVALKVGNNVTLWRTAISTEEKGMIEIGDFSYLTNASLVCAEKITIGKRVFIAGGVTIADSDFHPLDPALRLADTIALSPIGNPKDRPVMRSVPVVIGDDVWIGFNATILKGVRIGAGAIIQPGALVTDDVDAGVTVSGNPAKPTSQ